MIERRNDVMLGVVTLVPHPGRCRRSGQPGRAPAAHVCESPPVVGRPKAGNLGTRNGMRSRRAQPVGPAAPDPGKRAALQSGPRVRAMRRGPGPLPAARPPLPSCATCSQPLPVTAGRVQPRHEDVSPFLSRSLSVRFSFP